MSSVICDEIAHRAGFHVSVGNWIAPDGSLILGTDYDTHHKETLGAYWKVNKDFCDKCEKSLQCLNFAVDDGYIRLVFRTDVCFQVNAKNTDELWSDKPNYKRMMSIIKRLEDIEIHIFSKNFYVIGMGKYITRKDMDRLQIKTI